METNYVIWGAMIIAILFLIAYRKRDVKPSEDENVKTFTVYAAQRCPKCGGTLDIDDGLYADGKYGSYKLNYDCKSCGFKYESHTGLYPDKGQNDCDTIYDAWSRLNVMWNNYCEKYKGEK